MVFFLEITKIWQTSRDFWFADFFLEIFIIHRLVWIFLWIFGCFECVSSVFCLNLLIIFQQLLDIVFQMLTLVVFHTFWGLSSFPIYLLDALDLLLEKVGLQEVAELTVALIRGHSVQLQQAFVHLNNRIFYIIPVFRIRMFLGLLDPDPDFAINWQKIEENLDFLFSHFKKCRGLAVVAAPAWAQVLVPNSQEISCLDGSFLECSLPTREARVRSPAGTCQSWDL